ncbi:hypothetical protein OPV22_024813 [Ensete ventricosum]|uniref:Uncharacterized protein n=1 Tax=Ensete ventricosum TaxID=4639 RepID=A0AAV8Q844_ENSVE|nr:hypothetical protein OPV22_024813 [Ensete ventricosum]
MNLRLRLLLTDTSFKSVTLIGFCRCIWLHTEVSWQSHLFSYSRNLQSSMAKKLSGNSHNGNLVAVCRQKMALDIRHPDAVFSQRNQMVLRPWQHKVLCQISERSELFSD